jgi:FKBP-type peptidyl-prolyl cis-trans isomerase
MNLTPLTKPLILAVAGLTLMTCSCASRLTGPGAIDPNAPEEFTITESGLKYRILRQSSGRKPTANDRVKVDYSGWLDDDSVFDSSYERQKPIVFGLGKVIPGWTEGLQLVGEGGMIELEIPSELGYGSAGQPPAIPPHATLHFKIELHSIE